MLIFKINKVLQLILNNIKKCWGFVHPANLGDGFLSWWAFVHIPIQTTTW